MSVKDPDSAISKGQIAKADLEQVKLRLQALRVRADLAMRSRDADILSRVGNDLKRDVKPQAKAATQSADGATKDMKVERVRFYQSRKPKTVSRAYTRTHD